MLLKQISVFVENKPGAVFAPCGVLAEAGINLSSLSLADTKDFGILRIITKDTVQATEILRQNNFAVNIADVLAIRIEDKPGALSGILKTLEEKVLNIQYMYAAAGKGGKTVMIFRFDDAAEAVEKLKGSNCRLISTEEFF